MKKNLAKNLSPLKFRFSLLNKGIVFDQQTGFLKTVKSTKTGLTFLASTQPNNPTIEISCSYQGMVPKLGFEKKILTIPLYGKSFKFVGQEVFISIDGPIPKEKPQPKPGQVIQAISIGGPEPKKIKLDITNGCWRLEPDLAKDVLNVSFDGSK